MIGLVHSLALQGAEVALYEVVCEETIARRRCAERNADPGGSFLIDERTFDFLLSKFEPLEPDETAVSVDTTE